MKQLPPFGTVLTAFRSLSLDLKYPVYVFIGKTAISDAATMNSGGSCALAIAPDKQVTDYEWQLIKGLRLILFADKPLDELLMQKTAFHLLQEGAEQVCIFNGDGRPVEIY